MSVIRTNRVLRSVILCLLISHRRNLETRLVQLPAIITLTVIPLEQCVSVDGLDRVYSAIETVDTLK